MIYKQFKDIKLSALGLGTMRLPTVNGVESDIDIAKTQEMVDYAINHGINYFDTAYIYHGGNSEPVIAKALSKYPRDSYYLATKFPGFMTSNMSKTEEIFEDQLKKCNVDYFDFYLLHNVAEKSIDGYTDESLGVMKYLIEQKKTGRIKHLGFSSHGSVPVLRRLLEKYGEHFEFCQLQINYIDWTLQGVKEKLDVIAPYNLPVIVMEPLRGGKLASLPSAYESKLRALRPDESMPAWGFRFLQTLPSVLTVLSGMSNMTQLSENIKTFEIEKPLNEQELKALLGIASEILSENSLPCTSCRYCVSHCPKELDIPKLISLYNEHVYDRGFRVPMTLSAFPESKRPEACIGCKSCENVCPQQLKISEAFKDFSKLLSK